MMFMKTRFPLIVLFAMTVGWVSLPAQVDQPNSFGKGSTLYNHHRVFVRDLEDTFNPEWAPFYHGVASGDPLADRVIIWTRVTPEDLGGGPVEVGWRMATDPELTDLVASGTVTTDAGRDYTVKVDVTGLTPGTTYYYGFTAFDRASLTGKTKTTPVGDAVDHLRFGVVSCSNYQAGYFNAYGRLAARSDLDAVIHLGDYIYEYANFVYGSDSVWQERLLEPATEIISLPDYRARYSTYRLDTNLIRLHQQHPMIAVWDDHESANDAYVDGAENHDPAREGSWEERKAVAKQVYFEWMPIRDNDAERVYRTLRYGELMDLIMLDTRLEGREKQILDVTDSTLYSPDRTLLGAPQKDWLFDQLSNSRARWKVIGQQVLFSEFNVGWAGAVLGVDYGTVESVFLDIWDGYPAERRQLLRFIEDSGIDNVVILTGDFHTAFACDVADPAVAIAFVELPGLGTVPFFQAADNYDPATGGGATAVEFATPSITSANFDENVNLATAQLLEGQMNSDITAIQGLNLGNPNPHMKYVDLIQHGYYLLDVKPDSLQAEWYYSPILEVTDEEVFDTAYYAKDGENHLRAAAAPGSPKAQPDTPAPMLSSTEVTLDGGGLLVLSAFPNPAATFNTLHYALNQSTELRIDLYDAGGRLLRALLDERVPAGIYTLDTDLNGLPAGMYVYRIVANGRVTTQQVIRQ